MLLRRVRVTNFRSLLEFDLELGSFTALVGKNGVGKSAVLRAIELFYAPSPSVGLPDFYANDESRVIEIELTFVQLSDAAEEQFERYLQDGQLTVVRRISSNEGKFVSRYHGSTRQNPDFGAIRAAPSATELRARYEALRQSAPYEALPRVRSQDEARAEMSAWERENPEALSMTPDDGQFFGFSQVAQGYLGRHTRLISIPAVRDAALDASEGRGSAVSEILELVVLGQLRGSTQLGELQSEVRRRYDEIIAPLRDGPLRQLEERLSEALQQLVADAAIRMTWDTEQDVELPIPRAELQLVEDGYPSPVDRAGHGLQRAFLMALLQQLSSIRQEVGGGEVEEVGGPPPPDVLLCIEEPELFQHPSRQRHFASLLNQLADRDDRTSGATQVLCATHSPLFVRAHLTETIRLLRKIDAGPDQPRRTSLSHTTLDQVAQTLWEHYGHGARFSASGLRARLQSIMTPWMNEGFFADAVVLVEGEEDRGALVGGAAALGREFEPAGIAVVPCMGKGNLGRPYTLFRAFGIPVYLIWDSDAETDGEAEVNRFLLRVCGAPEVDWPDGVEADHACFTPNLTASMLADIGDELYAELVAQFKDVYGIGSTEQAVKNPLVVEGLVAGAVARGRPPTRLIQAIEAIHAFVR